MKRMNPLVLSMDEALERVGEFGRYQRVLDIIICLINVPVAMQVLMSTFTTVTPNWKCHPDNRYCINLIGNGTFSPDDMIGLNTTRCHLPKGSWVYTKPDHFSLVTQFQLHCERKWIIQLLESTLFAGWGIGAFVLGPLSDKYGRKTVMYPV